MDMPAQMPVVVTASGMRKTRAAQEALESVNEAARRESEAPELHPDTENISPTAAMERIFDELIKAEDQAGVRVLTTPHEGPWAAMASRLQSSDCLRRSRRHQVHAVVERGTGSAIRYRGLVGLGVGGLGKAEEPQAARDGASENHRRGTPSPMKDADAPRSEVARPGA